MPRKSKVVGLRLSSKDLLKVEAVRALEKVNRSILLRDFIENGLRD
jgi:hypothetical protein